MQAYAEKKVDGEWQNCTPDNFFDIQCYALYGFLANVRNYAMVTPLSEPRGLPPDLSPEVSRVAEEDNWHWHSTSWLSVAELIEFDYDQPVENRRVTGANTCPPGEGEMTTYRKLFPKLFFDDLEKLRDLEADRIVFWFS